MEDQVENLKKFAEHVEAYIRDRTVEKYSVKISGETAGFDLMSISQNPLICVWNILRYSQRIWNGKQEPIILRKSLIMLNWHGRCRMGKLSRMMDERQMECPSLKIGRGNIFWLIQDLVL